MNGETTVECPGCHAHVSVPEGLRGKTGKCPHCGSKMKIPEAAGVVLAVMSEDAPDPDIKACPYCGEGIKKAAILCRFCGMHLERGEPVAARAPSAPATPAAAPTAPAAAPARPAAAEEPETVIWETNPAYVSYLGFYILGGVLAVVGIGIVIIIWAILDRNRRFYRVTNKRVSIHAGIIGRHSTEVEVLDIRNVVMKQSVLDRILGIGNVGISSAGTGQVEVVFVGVSYPEAARDLVTRVKGGARTGEAYAAE